MERFDLEIRGTSLHELYRRLLEVNALQIELLAASLVGRGGRLTMQQVIRETKAIAGSLEAACSETGKMPSESSVRVRKSG